MKVFDKMYNFIIISLSDVILFSKLLILMTVIDVFIFKVGKIFVYYMIR